MSETPESPRVDAAVGRYLSQTLRSREALNQDGQYHLQVQWLRETLARAEQAMAAEGIPNDVRDRVIHRVLYGSLDEQAAIDRVAAHRAAAEQARWENPRFDTAELARLFEAPTGAAE